MSRKKIDYRLRIHPRVKNELYEWANPLPSRESNGFHVWRLEPNMRYWLLRLWDFKRRQVTARIVTTYGGILREDRWTTDNIKLPLQMRICAFLGIHWKLWRNEVFVRKSRTLRPGQAMFDPALQKVARVDCPPS
jgi:hypothetical protein